MGEAIATAFQEGEGIAVVLLERTPSPDRLRYTEFPACSRCDTPSVMVTPALVSFNNPRGACAHCNGFGAVLEYDESLIVCDPQKSLTEGAIDPWPSRDTSLAGVFCSTLPARLAPIPTNRGPS